LRAQKYWGARSTFKRRPLCPEKDLFQKGGHNYVRMSAFFPKGGYQVGKRAFFLKGGHHVGKGAFFLKGSHDDVGKGTFFRKGGQHIE
jgi:hypothetical protein